MKKIWVMKSYELLICILMSQISIWPLLKTWLSTWWQNPCWQSQRSDVSCSPIFNALALTVHGPVHRPFDAVQLYCPLSRKTPPKHNVSTSMFDGGDGVLGVIGSIPPPNTASWVDAKEFDFGLIWPQHFHPVLLWIIGKLQTGLYMCFLEQGDLAGAAGFQSFTA